MREVFIILEPDDERKLADLDQDHDRIEHLLRVLLHEARRRGEKLMAEIDDLNAAVTNLQNSANTIITKLDELKNTPAGVDPAAVAAAAASVQTVADSLNTAAQ